MPEIVKILLIFAVIAIWPLYLLIKAEYRRTRNNRSPEVKIMATAVKKSVTSDNVQYAGRGIPDTVFYGTFVLENGQTVELYMSGQKYVSFEEGDVGLLWYQGTKMLGFTKKE